MQNNWIKYNLYNIKHVKVQVQHSIEAEIWLQHY